MKSTVLQGGLHLIVAKLFELNTKYMWRVKKKESNEII